MIFTITNDKLVVSEAPDDAIDLIAELTTIKTTKFVFARNEKPRYDGNKYEALFDRDSMSCAMGHFPGLLGACRKAGFATTLVDKRVRLHEPDPAADLAWLRDYQREAVDLALKRTRGIWNMPTGSGKTDSLVGLLRSLPEDLWLILVHRKNLVRDIVARANLRADEHGHEHMDIGVYGDGDHCTKNRIIVATTTSIALNLTHPEIKLLLKSRTGVFVDECHGASAENAARVIRKCTSAYWRFGGSGTPMGRSDKRSQIAVGLLGPVIYELKAKTLVDANVLAKPTINIVSYDDDEFESDLWMKVKQIGIIDNPRRNAAVIWAAKQAPKPALLFIDTIEHGQALTKELQSGGMNVELVWGKAKTSQRAAAIKRLVRGDIDLIVTSPVFDEGVDIPALEAVVLGGGGQSIVKLLQRIGRGMRKAAGKDTFAVYDFADRAHRILAKHAAERRRVLKAEGHTFVKLQAPSKL